MKLWIDDKRPVPDDSWTLAVNSEEALEILTLSDLPMWEDTLEEVSFDHDLGGNDTTRRVMLWMIENNVWPKEITVHTSNPPGREWLVGTANRYAPDDVKISVIRW